MNYLGLSDEELARLVEVRAAAALMSENDRERRRRDDDHHLALELERAFTTGRTSLTQMCISRDWHHRHPKKVAEVS